MGPPLSRLIVPPDPAQPTTELTAQKQAADALTLPAPALRTLDGVGHALPVPWQFVHGTQVRSRSRVPLSSIHSPPAPRQVPHTGFSSLPMLMTVRQAAGHVCYLRG